MNQARSTLPALVVLIALTFSAPPRVAAASAPVDPQPFRDLMPEIRTASAPTWLRPGTRLTFYSSSAIVDAGDNRYEFIEDAGGDWQNVYTKKRYRREFRRDPGGRNIVALGSGHGYTQITVVYLDASVAVLDLRSYGRVEPGGMMVLLAGYGSVNLPGAGGEWWLPPPALGRLVGTQAPGFKVLRGPYPLGGKTYQAIGIESGSQSWVYEESTGILLTNRSASETRERDYVYVGGGAQPAPLKTSMYTSNAFVDGRVLSLPWGSSPAPDWVSTVRTLEYDGSHTAHVAGVPSMSSPVYFKYERQFATSYWARYLNTTTIPGLSGLPSSTAQVVRVFGPAQIGSLWIHPRALSMLQPNQMLDRDRFTDVETSVSHVGPSQVGDVVAIVEKNTGNYAVTAYDRSSGVLVYTSLLNRMLNTVLESRLKRSQ